MDLVESIVNEPAPDIHGSLAEGLIALAAAIRTGNDILKNQIIDSLRKIGIDSTSAMAMVKFVMDERTED